jgi:hypothetical protein
MATVRLEWRTPYHGPPAPHLLRGALAERFADNPLFHQHIPPDAPGSDRVLYRYPRVHYRWDHGDWLVVGFGEGAQALLALPWPSLSLRLGEQTLEVLEATCTMKRHAVAPTPGLVRYRFRAPWIALNQENYARYRDLSTDEQMAERDRLAVAGLLMALRGLGIEFPERLYAAFHLHHWQTCVYKDQEWIGFNGLLFANVDLPEGFAFGRAVSHGYGWIVRERSPRPTGDPKGGNP